eukprot:Unigene7250_Nuclearia_a/m.22260 Unigene7250_Nuclearia_a/g.22260  ORF Unigene7250_Nuclearia_a/g.22260 Unigene7250_Nuclearia_a/m.22260 type:complete len:345 (-) Unigene7250_Nuclearia_a:107-1141(-)
MSLDVQLLGMENPLLDISAEVDDALLQKYGLKSNDAILAEPKHLPIYDELVAGYKVDYIAGGSTQNTMRVGAWALQQPKRFAFMGCVGKDANGDKLRAVAEAAGVDVRYRVDPETPTGVCGVLLTGKHRSMVTNLAAANKYTEEHLLLPDNWAYVEGAKFFYSTGYFVTVSPASIMRVAKHAAETNKIYAFNLAAPFVSQFFTEPLMASSPYWDILFGNEEEARTFAKVNNFGTEDVTEIALKIAALPKANASRARLVLITQGALPTVVVENGVASEHPVLSIKLEEIVDTNGAGDAFVGGFLAALVRGKTTAECVRTGQYAARVILQQPGCTLPAHGPDAAFV